MKIMTGTDKRQAGFSIMEVALIIVVIGLLVGTGWYAYQHNKPKSGNAAPGTNQPAEKPDTPKPGPTVAYLEVKEWGVKIPLSEKIKDAYYVVGGFSDAPDGLPGGVYVSVRSLTSKECNPGNNDRGGTGAIGSVHRVLPTTTDAVSGELLTEEYPGGTTLDGFYYFYQSWIDRSSCGSENVRNELDATFAASVQGIVTNTDR